MKVTKLDAARRQLDTAIELWFHDADPVSIHTLVFASHEIIHRLFKRQGGKDLLFDSSRIKEEFKKEFNIRLKKWSAFFKHAERETNPDDAIDFKEGINMVFLVLTIQGLVKMGKKLNAVESAFIFRLSLFHPDWFLEDVGEDSIPPESVEQLKRIDKANFLEGYLHIWTESD
jgi:hypothetical protein